MTRARATTLVARSHAAFAAFSARRSALIPVSMLMRIGGVSVLSWHQNSCQCRKDNVTLKTHLPYVGGLRFFNIHQLFMSCGLLP